MSCGRPDVIRVGSNTMYVSVCSENLAFQVDLSVSLHARNFSSSPHNLILYKTLKAQLKTFFNKMTAGLVQKTAKTSGLSFDILTYKIVHFTVLYFTVSIVIQESLQASVAQVMMSKLACQMFSSNQCTVS